MSMITYPLNNVEYTAEDAELYNCTRTSGVYSGEDFSCTVSGTNNNVTIGEGVGWIRNSRFSGKVFANKAPVTLKLDIADAINPRIDIVAVRFDVATNTTDLVIKKGTAAANPVMPEIVQTENVYELYLFSVYRETAATVITADNVTDLRLDASVCGLMADAVTSVDTSVINKQFTAYLEHIKKELADLKVDKIDAYSKEETLTDATKAMFGFDSTAGPDDIFRALILPKGYYGYCIKVTLDDGSPVAGLSLTGLTDLQGDPAVTDENGQAVCISESNTVTVTLSGVIGIADKEDVISVEPNKLVKVVNLVVEKDDSVRLIRSSQTLNIYNVGTTIDMCLVGGGAGGACKMSSSSGAGPGGGGGYVTNVLGVTLGNPVVELTVGAGGYRITNNSNNSASTGGTTTVVYDGITATAAGATGQTGNGNGGAAHSDVGKDGTVHVFDDETLPLPGGGGGGGTYAHGSEVLAPGGKDFGGYGGNQMLKISATVGSGPGGGGGGGAWTSGNDAYPANGASGGLYIRVNFPSSEVTA